MAWRHAADMPLAPRYFPFAIWTGSEVLVSGGVDRTSEGGVPPLPELRDGAAYDPASDTWRPIADAPQALSTSGFGPSVVVDDTVVVAQMGVWLAYDVGDDEWRTLPDPPRKMDQPTLAVDDDAGVVYALDTYSSSEMPTAVQVLDLTTDSWSALPLAEEDPELDDRTLVATDAGLLVVGARNNRAGAESWDRASWTRLPDSRLYGTAWFWTGRRVVSGLLTSRRNAEEGGLRRRPGALDPATGRWSRLPLMPPGEDHLFYGGVFVTSGDQLLIDGYLYDDGTMSFSPIHAPDNDVTGGGVVLADGLLMSFGGYVADPDPDQQRVTDVEPTRETWVMRVES